MLDTVAKEHTIGQAGEPVVHGLVLQLFLGLVASLLGELLRGDVANQEADPPRRPRTGDRSKAPLEPPDARRNVQAVLPDLWPTRLEHMDDDLRQTATDLITEVFTQSSAQQLLPGRHE